MDKALFAVGFTVVVALGCSGLDELVAPAPPAPVPLDPLPIAEPEDPPPMLAAPVVDPFEEIDGWVGLAVVSEPGDRWWVPRSGGAVVSWSPDGWDAVKEGASFVGLTGSGPVELVFTGVKDVGWCTGTAPAATFSALSDVGDGAVWIVKERGAAAPSRVRETRSKTSKRRLFEVRGVEIDVQRSGTSGRTVVEKGGGRPWLSAFAGDVDLRRDDAIGPMWPVLGVTEASSLDLLFRVHSEGSVAWEWVRIDGKDGRSLGRHEVPAVGCAP